MDIYIMSDRNTSEGWARVSPDVRYIYVHKRDYAKILKLETIQAVVKYIDGLRLIAQRH